MTLRDLTTLADCRQVVELEKKVWGYTDAEDVVPVPVLIVTIKRGGILIGAFDDDQRMVGFIYSLPGLKDGRPTQWSHMLGVLPDHRDGGLGTRLKLAQRDRTIAMGLDLIEWTYDPLQALNAHLNFSKLGVIAQEYEENIYGDSSSPLHRGNPTDRFVAEWWVTSPRVRQRLTGPIEPPQLPNTPVVNETRRAGQWLECGAVTLDLNAPQIAVEIPAGFTEMLSANPRLARQWRAATREIFVTYFGRGYRAVEFSLQREKPSGRYLLAR